MNSLLSGLHQRQGQSPSTGSFSDRFLNDSPAISAAQNAHTQAVVFEVAKAIRTPLDQLHFSVKAFCDAVIPGKTEHSGYFFPPIMQRLAQGAQRREASFRSCSILSNNSATYLRHESTLCARTRNKSAVSCKNSYSDSMSCLPAKYVRNPPLSVSLLTDHGESAKDASYRLAHKQVVFHQLPCTALKSVDSPA